jgi:hypothetical protein
MMKTILVVTLMFTCVFISAQEKRISYRSQNFIGLLEGDNHKAAFQLQTIHGLQVSKWYAGVGAGLDYYLYRSIPLFVSLNRDVLFNKRTFFIAGDIGTNLPWVKNNVSAWRGQSVDVDFEGGLYWAGSVGYKAFLKNQRDAIVLSLGYSYKHLKSEEAVTEFCQQPPCLVNLNRFDYRLNRVSIKVGWQF